MAVAPQPSARLVRAVAAERAELERHRARLRSEADELRASLARIEHGLAEIDERRGLLDRLAPTPPARGAERDNGDKGAERAERALGRDDTALRGPDIREVAVKLLVANGREAMHYREWYALLERAGHEIAGKDPLAVFLTQLGRSPAVRHGSRAGVYELDRGVFHRLRLEIDALQHELGALPATGTHDGAVIRARRARLTTEISRAERALEEVARVLGPRPSLAATA